MKKRKVVAMFTAVSIVFVSCFLFGSTKVKAEEAGKDINRIFGEDRYKTNLKVVQAGWETSHYGVLTTAEDFPDALSAAPLAGKYGAPILLNIPSSLSSDMEDETDSLGTKEMFIVGGPAAISNQIEDRLTEKGINFTRLFGQDRYGTSAAVANYLGKSDRIIIASGENFPDALSVASYAAAKQIPILLTEHNRLPDDIKNYIVDKDIHEAYIIGGTGAISKDIEAYTGCTWTKRIAGANRYETNMEIMFQFADEIDLTNTYFANGENFPDALSASVLAAKTNSPIILASEYIPDNVANEINYNKDSMTAKYVIGGEAVTPTYLINRLIR